MLVENMKAEKMLQDEIEDLGYNIQILPYMSNRAEKRNGIEDLAVLLGLHDKFKVPMFVMLTPEH